MLLKVGKFSSHFVYLKLECVIAVVFELCGINCCCCCIYETPKGTFHSKPLNKEEYDILFSLAFREKFFEGLAIRYILELVS